MIEWISVKDRLPAHKSTVIILMEKREKYDYVNIVLYDAHKNAFLWQDGSEIKGVEKFYTRIVADRLQLLSKKAAGAAMEDDDLPE